jgi:hypothetical protein
LFEDYVCPGITPQALAYIQYLNADHVTIGIQIGRHTVLDVQAIGWSRRAKLNV